MTILNAMFLGLVQGISEFLPISSSGHLLLLKHYFNIQDVPVTFDVMLHAATLLATCIIFRQRIMNIIQSFFSTEKWYVSDGLKVIAGSAVTAAIALTIRPLLYNQLFLLGIAFFITAVGLISLVFVRRSDKTLTVPRALFIGLIQGMAVMPGLSRSGLTIAAGMHVGLDRKEAAEFSFILSIPAIAGATLLNIPDVQAGFSWIALFAGMLTAFVSGYVALTLLLRILQKGRLYYFAPYVFLLAVLSIISG